ncbi:HXT4 [[Candida] subhashii]|uniref:HXT4 n=1 Tax=[Candida] subhashii TaxID=561895 RepID=A0A8J5QDP6_9ASCO|nr:HXT4 [[Candida] subhashii]KAG7660367.1 HXT4 [[Candida] subhashii]
MFYASTLIPKPFILSVSRYRLPLRYAGDCSINSPQFPVLSFQLFQSNQAKATMSATHETSISPTVFNNEKAMVEIFPDAKSDKVSVSHDSTDSLELGADVDVDQEFEKYVQMGQDLKQQGGAKTFLTNLKNLEFPVTFKNRNNMVRFLGIFTSFAGILSGVDQSIISGASIGMNKALQLTSHENSLVSSLMPLGAVGGSILMTPLSEYFGRKRAIVISCILYTIGAVICCSAMNHHVMYAGRFILGLGVGIEGGSIGVYIAECVPPDQRGNLVSLYQFFIAFGEVLGFAIAAMFYDVTGGWRFMIGSSLVFSTILLIGILFLPESPRYLVFKEKYAQAINVYERLRHIEERKSRVEFLQMVQNAQAERDLRAIQSRIQVWLELFTIPRNRRALLYAVVMVSLGQLTGINAVMYYLSTMMANIGFDEKNAVFMSLVGGVALWLGTIPAILYMDRFGRRVWGMNLVGFFVGLVLVGGGYMIDLKAHPAAAEGVYLTGYTIDLKTNPSAAEGVYLTGLILYMGFFGAYACLTWVLPAESFSIGTRSIGMTICSSFLYLWAFTVTYNFNSMKEAMTYPGLSIGFYGGIAFLGFFYQIFFMPETKGKTLEEIDEIFEKPSMELARENMRNMKRFWMKN